MRCFISRMQEENYVKKQQNLREKEKLAVISNIFMVICALSACYIVLMRSDVLNFVRFIDNSTYTLETILVCTACALLIRRVYLNK